MLFKAMDCNAFNLLGMERVSALNSNLKLNRQHRCLSALFV